MTKDEMYQIFENYSTNDWKLLTKCHDNPIKFSGTYPRFKDVIDFIKSLHPMLSFSEAVYLAKNHIESIPTCISCGNQLKFKPSTYTYGKFCNHKCRIAFKNYAVDSIQIEGIIYKDFRHAMDTLDLSREVIRNRIFSISYPDWNFVVDHDQTCITKINEIDPILNNKEFLVEWKNSGKSVSSLAEYLGKHRSTIKCALLYYGIETEHEQIGDEAIKVRDNKELLEELYKTKTTDEIADMIDVTPKAVQNWIHKHGIQIDYARSQSKVEREFIEWISNEYPDVSIVVRDTETIGIELDIYLPEYKLAIEFDGLYYHSENPTTASKQKHATKQKLCYKYGVRLLNFIDIGESSVEHKKEIIKSIIASKIGKTNKLYARKCEIAEIDSQTASAFFIDNHISGNRPASRYIGLVYNNEIVMIMSFGKPFANKKYDWEIVRMASKKFLTVVGGASKIFNYFLKNSDGTIMTYANLRFGSGNVYKQIGFTYVHNTGPGYIYTNMKEVFSRNQFQKPRIQKLCVLYDPSKTEYENAENNGYKVYWDCGHLMFEYIR